MLHHAMVGCYIMPIKFTWTRNWLFVIFFTLVIVDVILQMNFLHVLYWIVNRQGYKVNALGYQIRNIC